jgi:hypothetical protein
MSLFVACGRQVVLNRVCNWNPSPSAATKRKGDLPLGRTAVADAASLSEHKRKTALRIANLPREISRSALRKLQAKDPLLVQRLAKIMKSPSEIDMTVEPANGFNLCSHHPTPRLAHGNTDGTRPDSKSDVLNWTPRGRSVPAPSDRSTCRAIWRAVQRYDIFHLPIANCCSGSGGARLKRLDDYALDKGTHE